MRERRFRARVAPMRCLCMLLLASLATASNANPLYQLTPLGFLGNGDASSASAINSDGRVVGGSRTIPSSTTGWHAFVWDSHFGMRDLGELPGGDDYSNANGINDAGQVVGKSRGNELHAFLWDAESGMRDLGTLPGYGTSYGKDVNNNGQVVGCCDGGQIVDRTAFIWDAVSGMEPITGGATVAEAVNDAGQVVGLASGGAGPSHGFVWDSVGGLRLLGVLPGYHNSSALALNESGHVVGVCTSADWPTGGGRAFLWDAVTGMRDLGVLAGCNYSAAYGINDMGQVVGVSKSFVSGPERAFVWTSANGMIDLNTVLDASGDGWFLYDAYAINDAGQIAGYGASPVTGESQAFLLTPIPEPSSLLALAGGLGGLGGMVWRRRR